MLDLLENTQSNKNDIATVSKGQLGALSRSRLDIRVSTSGNTIDSENLAGNREQLQRNFAQGYYSPLTDLKRLYMQFGKDLKKARAYMVQFRTDVLRNEYAADDLEMEITYLRIRDFRPSKVMEVSPHGGYTSVWILKALQDNEWGHLYAFDKVDKCSRSIPAMLSARWTLVLGDPQDTVPVSDLTPDYIIIDSKHTPAFTRWYTQNIFQQLKKHAAVQVHDIYHPTFYGDEPSSEWTRDPALHPTDEPTHEGLILIEWIAFSASVKNVFTLATCKAPRLAQRIQYVRESVGIEAVGPQANPSIFFEIIGTANDRGALETSFLGDGDPAS